MDPIAQLSNKWLLFQNAELELKYQENRAKKTLLPVDIVVHMIGTVHGIQASLLFGQDIPLWLHIAGWIGWVFPAVFLATLAYFYPNIYTKRRTLLVSFVRICVLLIVAKGEPSAEPPEPFPLAVISRLLTGTTVGTMIFMSLGLQLQFQEHIILQCLACAISLWATPDLCMLWCRDEKIRNTFRSLREAMDLFLVKLAHFGVPGNFQNSNRHMDVELRHSCWIISVFFNVFLGLWFTSTCIYHIERSSRVSFLQRPENEKLEKKVELRTKIANFLCTMITQLWLGVVVGMMVWFSARTVAELANKIHCTKD